MYGYNIRALRKLNKLSQQKLAMRCKIARETLSRIENGKQDASIDLLKRIARELGVPMCDLFKLNQPTHKVRGGEESATLYKADRSRIY